MVAATLPGDLGENPVRELARRFLVTFLLGVVIYRLGVFVPIPGVDVIVVDNSPPLQP